MAEKVSFPVLVRDVLRRQLERRKRVGNETSCSVVSLRTFLGKRSQTGEGRPNKIVAILFFFQHAFNGFNALFADFDETAVFKKGFDLLHFEG